MNDLQDKIKNAGVVGAGGAGFPTHVKISSKVKYIILNSAECEPLLHVDINLISEYADEILTAVNEILKATDAEKAYIGIKGKHKEAIHIIESRLKKYKKIELSILDDFYPAGDEQVLVYEVTGEIVPEGGIPLVVGCLVINVETALNIFYSLNEIPVTDTYVTINGDVKNPKTLKIPVGVSIKEAVSLSEPYDIENSCIIDGGPMMGKIVQDINEPVKKTTKGLIVLNKDHYLIKKKKLTIEAALRQTRSVCIQCRMCSDLCPRYLLGHNMLPHIIMRRASYERENIEAGLISNLCSECSICELYACPMGLSPRLINVNYKKLLREKNIKYKSEKEDYQIDDSREYRKIPIKRLITRLGLEEYDIDVPFVKEDYIPGCVKIPMNQHIGAPASPIVNIGQKVKRGELIGEIQQNELGANVHSSIDGVVKSVSSKYIEIERIEG